jgi:parallel beta-helix repeat protein
MPVGKRTLWASILVATAIVIVAIPTSAALAAGALFVSPNGSDSNPCLATKPCATISRAVSLATPNSTIIVSHGTYHDDVVLTKTINLVGQGSPTIDASGLDNGILVRGAAASRSSISGFTVQNANFEGILVEQANQVQILNNTVAHNDQGMFATPQVGECAASGPIPGDCGEGVHLMTSSDSRVIHNTIHDNAGGILLTDELGPTANNQLVENTVTHNQYDCGITLASHSPLAVANGVPQPNLAGVHDNLIVGNVANDNGLLGEGAGILVAAAGPGSGAWGNRIIGNEANGNGLPGITIHSHAPNQNLDNTSIIGNRLSNDALAGNNGSPGDGDFGVSGTTGIIVASAVVPLNNVQIVGNQIRNVHFGIWTLNVRPTTQLARTNQFTNVDVPVSQH